MQIAVVPPNKHLVSNVLFQELGDTQRANFPIDRIGYNRLADIARSNGNDINTIDKYDDLERLDCVLFVDINYHYLQELLDLNKTPALIYLMLEPPSIHLENSYSRQIKFSSIFDKILTWNDRLATSSDVFEKYHWPQKIESNRGIPFNKKKFMINVSSRKYSNHPDELYTEREEVINYYNNNHPEMFDLFGLHWNTRLKLSELYKYNVLSTNRYPFYNGPTNSKRELYQKYKFALCFENITGIDGYISEKIFDCFSSGIIPIYYGAQNISEYIPSDCFIDYREFGSPERLHYKLKSIDRDEYNEYLDNIERFLSSEKCDKFRPQYFAEQVYDILNKTSDRNKGEIPDELSLSIYYNSLKTKLLKTELSNSNLSRVNKLNNLIEIMRSHPQLIRKDPRILYHAFL